MTELFDLPDLDAYLRITADSTSAGIARRIATSLLTSYLGLDPRPDVAPATRTIQLDVDSDGIVRLPRLLTTLVTVSASGGSLTYTQRGSSLVVAMWGTLISSLPTGGPYVNVTYTYTVVPDPVRDAALITAASVYGPASSKAQGVTAEQIDDYRVQYADTAEQSIPQLAKDLLRPYRLPVRSAVLISPESGPRYTQDVGFSPL